MGNQLVGLAPSQIYPVEHYLIDHNEFTFDQSLGSTRFLKVVRAVSKEGLVVIKVFAIHDPSLPLAEHKERVLKIKEQLFSAFNCLPFQRVILTDKAALLIREYCKYSVYDRMSTRPFLTALEKKWITFQLLYALHRMHKLGVCHGDIKLENIMVTSWLWVLLTDIASFKPTFLPEDNPADFNYFFDSSRRRICYIAPERFLKTDPNDSINMQKGSDLILSESQIKAEELVPTMDIFSAGCALYELWNDGNPPLDLTGLLTYRSGDPPPPTMNLSGEFDPLLVELLRSMTQRSPEDRRSAEIYLDEARGRLFPEYFYSFLQPYMLMFSTPPIISPDEKIQRIYQDIKSITKLFTQPTDAKNYKDLGEETTDNDIEKRQEPRRGGIKLIQLKVLNFDEEFENGTPKRVQLNEDCEGLILIVSLVASCIGGLRSSVSKLRSLEILQLLSEYSNSEVILDRILPYVIYLTHDSAARVRAAALVATTRCLSMVTQVTKRDCNVFPEYILPELFPRATDSSTLVRIVYAKNMADLAQLSITFLDQFQQKVDMEPATMDYENELLTLHELVSRAVACLLTDSQSIVKRTLVESGITRLCLFFGTRKANDVILSHMVTFLNDKEDTALRACFFEHVVGVAAYVGQHAASILMPLMLQGLTDQSEVIIATVLRSMSSMVQLGLLQKPTSYIVLTECTPYLAHPNLSIRHEVCGLISYISCLLNVIDVQCKVVPMVWPYLTRRLMQLDKVELLLENLVEPVPRKVFDAVMNHSDVPAIISALEERHLARKKLKEGIMPKPSSVPLNPQLKNLFIRLNSDGMTDSVEDQLVAMGKHLQKIHRFSVKQTTSSPGRVLLIASNKSKCVQFVAGGGGADSSIHTPHDKNHVSSHNKKTQKGSVSHEVHMNTEWQHMFSHTHERASLRVQESTSASQAQTSVLSQVTSIPTVQSQLEQSASLLQSDLSPCRVELRNLICSLQKKYEKSLRMKTNDMEIEGILPTPKWTPGNKHLAILHEHSARVTQMATLPAHRNMFGSSSEDGTVRLWDVAGLQGNSYTNRSKSMFNKGMGPVVSIAACESGQSLVGATKTGSVFVLRLDSGSSRMTLSQSRQEDIQEYGDVEGVACTGAAHGGVVSYATTFAHVLGWDLRAPGYAWKLKGDIKDGGYCCIYANSSGYIAVGTYTGVITAWDVRFHLPITTIHRPKSERLFRIVGYGQNSSMIWACGNIDAGAWCLESTQRINAVWPFTNSQQALNYSTQSSVTMNSIFYGKRDGHDFLITGSSDSRIRYWDLEEPSNSQVLVHGPYDPLGLVKKPLTYKNRIIDGTSVVQEMCTKKLPQSGLSPEEDIQRLVDTGTFYHKAPITDLTMVENNNKSYLVSSSWDGVINMWK